MIIAPSEYKIRTKLCIYGLMRISRSFRICPICQAYQASLNFCCNHCERSLNKHIAHSNQQSTNYPFILKRLWSWNHKTHHLLKPLIHGLKGGTPFEDYYLSLAQKLYLRNLETFNQCQQPLFIPAPSKSGALDHANLLAKSLSQIAETDFMQILNYPKLDIQNQKRKNKSQRHELLFEKITTSLSEDRLIIFVDDLVTSGATVQAAYIALNRPTNFEVWALAEKELEHL